MEISTRLIQAFQQTSAFLARDDKSNEGTTNAQVSPEEQADSEADSVSISASALAKQNAEVNPSSGQSSSTDVIEKLKEMIEEIKKQLAALEGNDSPQAEEERKALLQQLVSLSGALLNAIKAKEKAERMIANQG
jgi:hypothetical protein